MKYTAQTEVGGRPLIIECGHLALQAGGAVTVRQGDTVVLITAHADLRMLRDVPMPIAPMTSRRSSLLQWACA